MHQQEDLELKAEAAAKTEAAEVIEKVPEVQPNGLLKYFEPSAIPFAILSSIYLLPMGFVINYLTLYAEQSGVNAIALFFTCSAIAMLVARLAFGKIADHFGPITVVAPGIALYVIAFTLILIAPNKSGFITCAAGTLYGLSTGMTRPVLAAEVIKQVPARRRGVASGTYMISFDIGIAGGGAIWGLTIGRFSYAPTLYACIALAVIAFAYSFIVLKKSRKTVKS